MAQKLIRLLVGLTCLLSLQADAATENFIAHNDHSFGVFTSGHFPIFSSRFVGLPSPFHETVATLVRKGARLQPAVVAENLWRQGVQNVKTASFRVPIYMGSSNQPKYRFSCVTYGKCAASGRFVHLPLGARSSFDSDHHISSFDTALGGELDGWGGDGKPSDDCNARTTTVHCSWGGFFPFSGNGLDRNSGASANNGGYAFGLFVITAEEILQGHIDHALGMVVSCLDDPAIYPADTSKGSDTKCSDKVHGANPQYGQLIHLRTAYNIRSSQYSPECKVLLTALQTYGAYTYDTNNGWGIALVTDDITLYANPNPWVTTIFREMRSYDDAAESEHAFVDRSCLNRLNASDLEVFDLASNT